MFRRTIILILFSWLSLLQACGQRPDRAYHLMLNNMYSYTVPMISSSELQEKLRASSVVLLDTRTKEEYQVSRLKGARFVGFDDFDLNVLAAVPKNKPIVVYCSVGYRSEKIGEKLKQTGYTNVYNLYGGIFQWVNEEKPVYNRKGKTDKVHAYSRAWGIWLREGEKVYGE